MIQAIRSDALRSSVDLEHSRACEGQFEEDYRPLRSIGKGAFGFVWLASRRKDEQDVSDFSYITSKCSTIDQKSKSL